MVWFSCEDCGESVKKPKLPTHLNQCSGSKLTCLDCNCTFDSWEAQAHNRCVTEHEKYALGVTKGLHSGSVQDEEAPKNASEPSGLEFLSTRPPWKCSICNVTCTSQETLAGHASGAKHIRRVKAHAAQNVKAVGKSQEAEPEGNAEPPSAGSAGGVCRAVKKQRTEDDAVLPLAAEPMQRNGKKRMQKGAASGDAEQEKETEPTEPVASPDSGATAADAVRKVKWKKLAAAELRHSGEMRMNKLQRRVLKAAGLQSSSKAKTCFLHRIQSSSQFVVVGGVARLS